MNVPWSEVAKSFHLLLACPYLEVFPQPQMKLHHPTLLMGLEMKDASTFFWIVGGKVIARKKGLCVRSTHSVEHIGSTWVAKYDKICLPKTGPARLNNSVKWQGLKQTHPYNKIIIDNYDWHAKTKNPHKLFTSIWWDCGWSFDRHCLLW